VEERRGVSHQLLPQFSKLVVPDQPHVTSWMISCTDPTVVEQEERQSSQHDDAQGLYPRRAHGSIK